jgi:hypothetical protein
MSGIIPKGQWHWQKAGKGRANEGKLSQAVGVSAESPAEKDLSPPPKASQVGFGAFFPPLLSSGSRWISSSLASLIVKMTPLQHTTLSGSTIPAASLLTL